MAGIEENVISAGIDVGTSTTQVIFSRIRMKNTGGFGSIPKIEIVEKKIFYRSRIHFTPLVSEDEIDEIKVKGIVEAEYRAAGVRPAEVAMGAVIITGETSRKRNAKAVVHALSELAGDFVVAAAGPNMESILAGKGSGAKRLSEEMNCVVANLDIGGGTTNLCFFENGRVLDTACFNIGGRLVKITKKKIDYVSDKLLPLLSKDTLIKPGAIVEGEVIVQLKGLVKKLVNLLEQSVLLIPQENVFKQMITNQQITCNRLPDIITFSGGVADCIRNEQEDLFTYNDIGCLLGAEIFRSIVFSNRKSGAAGETMNATVIGAGNFSVEVSGSTIEYRNCDFPYKNVPVLSFDIDRNHLENIENDMKKQLQRFFENSSELSQVAFSSKGINCPSFDEIEQMADSIAVVARDTLQDGQVLLLVMEYDIAKSLGQAIRRRIPRDRAILCIDHIACGEGDYIDIGIPTASGKVVPVVVKTLLFQN